MKKILAAFLAVVLMLPVGVFGAFASTAPHCVVELSSSTDSYNAGDFIDITMALSEVSFEAGDGVSIFYFGLGYDNTKVTLVNQPLTDSDGVDSDYSALATACPKGWEILGKNTPDEGRFEFMCADISGKNVVIDGNEIIVTMRFKVLSGVAVDDIYFWTDDVEIYNADATVKLSAPVEEVIVHYAPQPNSVVSLPSDAIPLHYSGYSNKLGTNPNFIFYTKDRCFVRDYVSYFIDVISDQDKLTDYVLIIADKNGKVTLIDKSDSDKSYTNIPEDSFILVIDKDNTANVSALNDIEVGNIITLYNINVEGTGNLYKSIALNKAGFTFAEDTTPPVDPDDPDNPDDPDDPDNPEKFDVAEGAPAVLDDDRKFVRVYASSLSLEAFTEMFVGDFEVVDFSGNYVSTGMTISAGEETITIIIMGDVNSDGNVDKKDYAALKRFCFATMQLGDNALLAADINQDSNVDKKDYATLKRACFGTIKLDGLM